MASAPVDQRWADSLDLEELNRELNELETSMRQGQGKADEDHLTKMLTWQRACFWIGYLTCWYTLNPLSIFLISCGICVRWTMIGHHVCHGGYDNQNSKYNRKKFAIGTWRRMVDWLDWMLPEAWNCEHNQLHHYQLGEDGDPDLLQRNLAWMRQSSMHWSFKWLQIGFLAGIWKWFYYAPNTWKELQVARNRSKFQSPKLRQAFTLNYSAIALGVELGLYPRLFLHVLGPYFVWSFVVMPLLFFPLGSPAMKNVFISMVLAEILTNVHSFLIIASNHVGDDVYRFDTPVAPSSGEFYLRQIIGSVNYATGSDLNDFMHGYLNYQIEHHIWPDLSMLSYKKAQPLVKAICAKHGIPYIQQNVFWRMKKLLDIASGATSMPLLTKKFA
jgi:fatty acid desaturase